MEENNDEKTNDEKTNDEKTNDEKTKVINVGVSKIRPQYNNLAEWMKNKEEHVYIGRKGAVFIDGIRFPLYDSIWANPYKITNEQPREKVLSLYSEYIDKKIQNDNMIGQLLKLKGKKLGCWCKPECCHGDILVGLIKKYDPIQDSKTIGKQIVFEIYDPIQVSRTIEK